MMTPDEKARFVDKTIENGEGCWLWRGFVTPKGYGHFMWRGKARRAHRLAYQHFVGEIPPGMEIDHPCGVRRCVNPLHLRPLTHIDNVRAGKNGQKTHCPSGHPYSGGNLYTRPSDKARVCRACLNAHRAKRK